MSAKFSIENNSEVNARNAISRAYYCAYHAVLVLDAFIPDHAGVKKAGAHIRLISKLTGCHHVASLDKIVTEKLNTIGVKLKAMRDARNEADYRISDHITIQDAIDQINESEKILEKVAEVEKLLNQTCS